MYQTKHIAVYDLEVFPGYFLFGIQFPDGHVIQIEVDEIDSLGFGETIKYYLEQAKAVGYELAGFNSNGYDDLVLTAFLRNPQPSTAYAVSVDIIVNEVPRWKYDNEINSIDLMQILPGRVGLKKIGVSLGHKRLQELPIAYDKVPTAEEQATLLSYNRNDLEITRKLLQAIQGELDLRGQMSEIYGIDLRSKGEAAMAEIALLEALEPGGSSRLRKGLNTLAREIIDRSPWVTVKCPSWWGRVPYTPSMKSVIDLGEDLFSKPIAVNDGYLDSASVDRQLFIGDRYYTLGVGGLHSVDGAGSWVPAEDEILLDVDVASYYPNLMLTQSLYPRAWGPQFLDIYKSIVDRRIEAKNSGDTVTAQVLKIAANGTYGKTSDQYSSLYDPQVTVNVTVTGQLALLVLISMLEEHANVVSANTDGITVLLKKDKLEAVYATVMEWEEFTELTMEYTEYRALYQKDVNNYVAIKSGGGLKTKGRFNDQWPDLRHTPKGNIIATAVNRFLSEGISPLTTIGECNDINQFVLTQSVSRGWTTSWEGRPLGNMLRFYKSDSEDAAPIMRHPGPGVKGNEGIVSNSESCIPLEDLPDQFPEDLDRYWYWQEAEALIEKITPPKRAGMNRVAEIMKRAGLRPCLVELDGRLSRAAVTYGDTDFDSMPEGWTLGTGTGDGILARVYKDGHTQLFRVAIPFPSKTRKLIEKNEGFTQYYGARVPVIGTPYHLIGGCELDLREYYTPAELRKVS